MSAAPVSTAADAGREITFWGLAAPVRGRIVLSGVLSALGATASVIPVLFAMAMVRALVPALNGGDTDTERAGWLLAGLLVSLVVAQFASAAGYTISHVADARLAEKLRQQQITQSLRLRLDWFSREGSGRIKKIVQDDVVKVHQLIAHLTPDIANGAVRPVVSLVVLFAIDWRLGLIALIPLTLAILSLPLMLKDMTSRFENYSLALGDLGNAVVEFVRGIAPIKVFEASGKGHRRFRESAKRHHAFYTDWMETTVYGSALMMAFTAPGFAITVSTICTTLLIVFAGLDPVALLPSVLLAANIAGPLYLLMQMQQFMREANGAAKSIVGFLSLPGAPSPDPAAHPGGTDLEVDEVSFAYTDGPRALDAVSLDLAPGTVTALVGPSGSGKSTLASVLPRLIDPDGGQVRLGGIDTQRLSPTELYRNVAFVFQRPYLLRMSVRDNIRLARPGAAEEAVIAAAKTAQIHDRILHLPEGYDTIVGEEARFSGGEQQRISIARAMLMDAPILVLDEATAFADPDSEAEIQRALASLTRGRTVLVVAHRLHTVVDAHRIAVLDRGTIVELGAHLELLERRGLYARMWEAYQRSRDTAEASAPPHTAETVGAAATARAAGTVRTEPTEHPERPEHAPARETETR